MSAGQRSVRDGKGGRVTVPKVTYEPRFAIIASYIYATGASDIEVAEALGVSASTINNWTKRHPEFTRARQESSEFVEARLAKALITAAEGAEKHEVTERYDEETDSWIPSQRKTTKMPPDVRAIMLWLQSRRPIDWQQKQVLEVQSDSTTIDLLEAGQRRMLAEIERARGTGDRTDE